MRWENLRRSKNVENRRGQPAARGVGRGGGRPVAIGGGCGTIIIMLICIFVFKVDPVALLGGDIQPQQQQAPAQYEPQGQSSEIQEFSERVKGSCEDVWKQIFRESGSHYRPAKMVSYSGATRMRTGGVADARMGPFYIPVEETIYLDIDFFRKMQQEMRAGGDFAFAYVIAHEVAHHVQKLIGATEKVHNKRGRISEKEYNRLSVRLELQADFLAGVWAHHANKDMIARTGQSMMEQGDIEEAMRAAKAIGDDAIQYKATGRIIEDSFTHGTSEQRLRWFMKGFNSGDLNQGDTFGIPYSGL